MSFFLLQYAILPEFKGIVNTTNTQNNLCLAIERLFPLSNEKWMMRNTISSKKVRGFVRDSWIKPWLQTEAAEFLLLVGNQIVVHFVNMVLPYFFSWIFFPFFILFPHNYLKLWQVLWCLLIMFCVSLLSFHSVDFC